MRLKQSAPARPRVAAPGHVQIPSHHCLATVGLGKVSLGSGVIGWGMQERI